MAPLSGPSFRNVKKVIAGISIFYTKADQLINKMEDLRMMIVNEPPDIIIINEVIPKAQRNIYMLDSLVYSSVELGYATTVGVEHMFFKYKSDNKQSALIGCMYRLPSANIETSTMAVCNIISLALNIEHTHFLLVGDFTTKTLTGKTSMFISLAVKPILVKVNS